MPFSIVWGQPAATQQSLNILGAEEQAQPEETKPKYVKKIKKIKKGKRVYYKSSSVLIEDRTKSQNPHPYLTYTPKSVYTPVGTPIQWGGIGLVGNVFNGYPTLSDNSHRWGEGAALILPLGNSDKVFGLALSVSEHGLQTGITNVEGSNGTFGLMGSRWITRDTIIVAGIANLTPWGSAFESIGRTYYGALTQYMGINILGNLHQLSEALYF